MNQTPTVNGSIVTPEYFHLLGMTLVRGRLFNDLDNETAPEVAVINESWRRPSGLTKIQFGKTPANFPLKGYCFLDYGDRHCGRRTHGIT